MNIRHEQERQRQAHDEQRAKELEEEQEWEMHRNAVAAASLRMEEAAKNEKKAEAAHIRAENEQQAALFKQR